jgi:hypothetical protein
MQPTVLTKNENVNTAIPATIFSDDSETFDTPSIDAPASKQEEEGEVEWDDSTSLYEEYLDDTEAFPYTSSLSPALFF